MIEHTPLGPLGARVDGADLARADQALATELTHLLAERGVVVVAGQHIDDREFVEFLSLFGALTFTPGETPVDGFPDLNVVSNVGRETPPRSVFHTDTSYVPNPPAYTALRAVTVPERGGATLFTDQYRALETLPPGMRELIGGRTVRHRVTDPDGTERSAEHPVLLRHPISGRTALYLSTPQRCVSMSGLPDAEGAELITFLYEHSTADANVHGHQWQPGDVVVWDNRCVLHKADHSDVQGDRVLHRGMATVAADG